MTDPTPSNELDIAKQRLRDEFETAMEHELGGDLGTPEAIRHLPRHVIRAEMNQFIIRLQAAGLDRMAKTDS